MGWGGVITFICTSSHIWCYVIVWGGVGWGGVGWGGVITFICTSSQIWCYVIVCRLALPHIHDYMMLRYCKSSCTFSQIWCYVIVCRLALPHIHDATLHFLTDMMLRYCMSSCTFSQIWCYVIVWGGVGWGGAITFICTSSHIWCYVIVWGGVGWGGVGWGNNVHLHFLTDMMLRYCMSSCTSSHTWYYATVSRLALSHRYDATLLYVVLHFLTYMMLRCTSSQTWCYATVCRLALSHRYDLIIPRNAYNMAKIRGTVRGTKGGTVRGWRSKKLVLDRSKTRTSGAWDSSLARCNACHNLEMIRG